MAKRIGYAVGHVEAKKLKIPTSPQWSLVEHRIWDIHRAFYSLTKLFSALAHEMRNQRLSGTRIVSERRKPARKKRKTKEPPTYFQPHGVDRS